MATTGKPPPRGGLYETQKNYYKSLYSSGGPEPWDGFFDGAWLAERLKLGPAPKNGLALDIGAGKGRGANILAKAGMRCVGMDYLLAPMLEAAGAGGKNGPAFINADLMQAPFKDGVFDLALDWGVFHHIRRKETGLYIRPLLRLLARDGRLLLGCFSTKFRHEGEEKRKRNFTLHKGHYDRYSTRRELEKTFGPHFWIERIDERQEGYYLLDMRAKGK